MTNGERADDALIAAVASGLDVYDLSRRYEAGMPQSPNHPVYTHALQRRHGDRVREDGGSAANDVIAMGTHVGTHIDALAHVSHNGELFGGVDALAAQTGGRFDRLGVETIEPIVARGLLLDVPAVLGVERCPDGYEITVGDLERAMDATGTEPRAGDVLLVRSGWAQRWDEGPVIYVGHESGVPGPGESAARWLAAQRPVAVGADSIAFEHLAPGAGHSRLPAHRVLLVEHGIYIIETLNLEVLAGADERRFTIVVSPLPLVGATGSPVRPLALVGRGR